MLLFFFFFQAEDGIRDRSPSRGLADVYKRQIIGYKVLGKLIFYRTVYATVCLSVFLGLIRPLPLLTGDVLVDGLCGGVIMGGGLGLIFLQNASSGGADMTAQIINRRIPHVSVPKLMAIVDGIIILFGIGVFGLRNGIYALIVLFVMTKVSDLVLEGPNHAKLMYIICLLYTSPSPRDGLLSRMPASA